MCAGSMASYVTELLTSCSNVFLSATAFRSSYILFKRHRAPSIGFFLLSLSAALCIFHPCSSYVASVQTEVEWATEVIAPALVSFEFLWLSKDGTTAHILLCGSCLLVCLRGWFSADALVLMTRCAGLSSLSCCLTVCVFTGNAPGAFSSVALSLPSLVANRIRSETFVPLISSDAAEGYMEWFLKLSMSVGCWTSTQAIQKFYLDVTTADGCYI